MTHVRQRYSRDCGLAVAAMVSGYPYDVVRDVVSRAGILVRSGTSIARMIGFLEGLTGNAWVARIPDDFVPLADHAESIIASGPAVYLIRWPELDARHWVATWDGYVYGPEEHRRIPVLKYPRRDWEVRRVLTSLGRPVPAPS